MLGKRILQNSETNLYKSPQKKYQNIDPKVLSKDFNDTSQSKNTMFSNGNNSVDKENYTETKNLVLQFNSISLNSAEKLSESNQEDNNKRLNMRSRGNKRTKKSSIDNIDDQNVVKQINSKTKTTRGSKQKKSSFCENEPQNTCTLKKEKKISF